MSKPPRTSSDNLPTHWDPLKRLSASDVAAYSDRLRIAQSLAAMEDRSSRDVAVAADLIGMHPATVYRDLRKIQGGGTVRDIAPTKRGFPKGRSRLHPRQDQIIEHWLRTTYLSPNKPSLSDIATRIGDQCEDEGFGRPARAAVIRRLHNFERQEIARKRDGAAAAHRATPHPGRLEVERPWDMYQIDHTLADVIVLDSVHLKPIGRAWLTLVIDVCTRLVVAFQVGLDPPSILRAGSALELAVSRKVAWLKSRGLDYDWPAEGFPRVVHSDNGSDFRSDAITRALLNQGVTPQFRRVGKPHWGAHIERLNGTLMGRCRLLPGATQNSPMARGDYDSKGAARIRVDDLQAWFAHEILGSYHNAPHQGLEGRTPLETWKQLADGRESRLPEDPAQFRMDLFPHEARTITAQGIKLFNEEYYSPELGAAFARGYRGVSVKFDPRDLSEIYVEFPHGYQRVGLRFPHRGPPPPLWLRRQGLRSLPEGKKRDRTAQRRAIEQAETVIANASARFSTQRRQSERLLQDRRAVDELRAGWSLRSPDDDDDWGGAFSEETGG